MLDEVGQNETAPTVDVGMDTSGESAAPVPDIQQNPGQSGQLSGQSARGRPKNSAYFARLDRIEAALGQLLGTVKAAPSATQTEEVTSDEGVKAPETSPEGQEANVQSMVSPETGGTDDTTQAGNSGLSGVMDEATNIVESISKPFRGLKLGKYGYGKRPK